MDYGNLPSLPQTGMKIAAVGGLSLFHWGAAAVAVGLLLVLAVGTRVGFHRQRRINN